MKIPEVGERVLTQWDDAKRPIPGVVLEKTRAHRGVMLTLRMKDGSVEKVTQDQLVVKEAAVV